MRARLPPVALLLVLFAACGEEVEPPPPGDTAMGPDAYRSVLVELAVGRVEALPDTQAWLERRRAILARHGVSAEDLRGFVDAYGRDDDVMRSLYRDLGAALDSVAAAAPPGQGAGRFPSAEDAARAAARAGEAVDTTPAGAPPRDTAP